MSDKQLEPRSATAPLLGCVADDVTGATDLALNLAQGGMRVVQWLGDATADELRGLEADALVIALKSRSLPADRAIRLSLDALAALDAAGCERFYFKYCSTFDSTDQGNIGPVAEALLDQLQSAQTIFCPAFPDAGRTVYAGHLFVNDVLLHESGMQDHPLNPMHDPSLVRVLERQSRQQIGLLHHRDVSAGSTTIVQRLQALLAEQKPLVVVDALDQRDLAHIASAVADTRLVTGGSGLARFLPSAYRDRGLLATAPSTPALPSVAGRSAVLAGSCSSATRAQVARYQQQSAACRIDVSELMNRPDALLRDIVTWIAAQPSELPVLVYSTDAPQRVTLLQEQFGREQVASQIEQLHAKLAQTLVDDFGVRKLVVAGGETSAAVAEALNVRALRIGPEIAPGVPWTESLGPRPLALAFKSGNFGDADFFHTALEMLG